MKSIIKTIACSLLAFAILYPAIKPLLQDQFFHLHDFTHTARLVEMDRALSDGHFPVRWSKNFGFGYGMPLFNFYGPLPFYLAEIFHLIGFSYLSSIKLIFLLTFVGGFFGMYYWSKKYFGVLGGLISATAFIYIPYRAVDTYVRGSVNELFGITFTLLALWAIDEYVEKRSAKWFVLTSVFLAGIITSHNISALFAFPAIAMYALGLVLFSTDGIKWKKIIHILLMFLFAGGLSASYAIPAFLEKNNVAIDAITSGYFHYSQHFLYIRQFINSPFGYGGSIYGLEDGLSFEIGKIHLVLLVIVFFGLFIDQKISPKTKKIMVLLFAILGGSMLMATFKSQFIWDKIVLLQYIQFPWRFLSLVIIFASFLVGATTSILKKIHLGKFTTSLMIIIALVLYNQNLFKPKEYLKNAQDLYTVDEGKIQSYMSSILPDYIPKNVPKETLPATSRFTLTTGDMIQPLSPTISRTHEFLVEVPIKESSIFTANIFYYPGWEIYINDKKIENLTIGSPLPVILLEVNPSTAGGDRVYISGIFTDTLLRKLANMISVTSILLAIYLWQKEEKSIR